MSLGEFLLIILIAVVAVGFYKLNRKVHRIMGAAETLAEYVAAIDAETTRIAEFIETQLNQTGATVEQLKTSLTPVVEKLKLVGTTPPVED